MDIIALLSALPMAAAALVGVFLGMWVEKNTKRRPRRRWNGPWRGGARKRPRTDAEAQFHSILSGGSSPPSASASASGIGDAADQLRIVLGASFKPQPLLNRGEARVFRQLEQLVEEANRGWHVMAQVSLGEILSSPSTDAYRCINSKRVDLLLVDGECRPRHAIEYQGDGHYQGTAAARDAIKKEALRRAGIGYHEVVAGHTTTADLRALIAKLVPPSSASKAA